MVYSSGRFGVSGMHGYFHALPEVGPVIKTRQALEAVSF